MDKNDIRKRLSRFIDKELSDKEIRETEELIKNNPVWQEEYNRLLSLQDMANRFELEADGEIWEKSRERIMAKIEAEEELEAKVTEIGQTRKRGTIYKLVAVAASIALVAFISIYEFGEIAPEQEVLTTPQMKVRNRNIPVPPKITGDERRALEMGKPLERAEEDEIPEKSKGDVDVMTEANSEKAPAKKYETLPYFPAEIDKENIAQKNETKSRTMFDSFEKSPEKILKEADRLKGTPSKQLAEKPLEPAVAAPSPETIDLAEPFVEQKKKEIAIRGGRTGETVYEIQYSAVDMDALSEDIGASLRAPDSTAISGIRAKADSLEPHYFDMISKHYAEIAAKRRQETSPEDLRDRAMMMIYAFYDLGRVTDKVEERKSMIGRLNELSNFMLTRSDSLMIDGMVDSLQKIDE